MARPRRIAATASSASGRRYSSPYTAPARRGASIGAASARPPTSRGVNPESSINRATIFFAFSLSPAHEHDHTVWSGAAGRLSLEPRGQRVVGLDPPSSGHAPCVYLSRRQPVGKLLETPFPELVGGVDDNLALERAGLSSASSMTDQGTERISTSPNRALVDRPGW